MPEPNQKQHPNSNALSALKVTVASALLRILSLVPLPLGYCAGILLGELIYWLYGSRRKVTLTNLAACYPELNSMQIRRLSRQHFHHMVIGVFTLSIAWWASPKRLQRLSTFHHREHLDTALQQGKNVILMAPHFTSLEILGGILFNEMPMTSMYQHHRNHALDAEITRRRTRFGSVLYDYKSSLKGLVKSIREGIPFYYLPDQDPGKTRGVFAPFFGIQTATFPALSKLARLGNASVIPCMARIRKYGTGIDIIFANALQDYPTGDPVEDATIMNHAIEQLIENAPAQYFWSHKRFKTRPDGEDPFY